MTLREHGILINFRLVILAISMYNCVRGLFGHDIHLKIHYFKFQVLWLVFGFGLQLWQKPRLDEDIKRVREQIEAGDYSEPI